MPENNNSINRETPTLQILAQIKSQTYDPKDLPQDIRQDLVEYLWHKEGLDTAVIAQILKVSDKTIRRDKDDIREKLAKQLNPDDRLKILGEFVAKLTSIHENQMRLSRSKDGSVQENSLAGAYAAKAIQILDQIYKEHGFGPLKLPGSEAGTHNAAEKEMTVAELKEELSRLEKIISGRNINDPEVMRLMEDIRRSIAIAEAKEALVKLKSKINDITDDKGSKSE